MNEAMMKKEEEEKKKKEEARKMRAGAPFGQPGQVEPAGKNPPAPFAPAAKEPEQAQKPAAPFAGQAEKTAEPFGGGAQKQGEEKNQAGMFQQARGSPFGDELMRDANSAKAEFVRHEAKLHDESQGVERRARADYEQAVAREKKALVGKEGRAVVVKKEGKGENKEVKEGRKEKDEKG